MNLPRLRFDGFDGEWNIKSFDDAFNIIDGDRGKNYPSSEDYLEEGHCLFLNAKNVTKKGFSFNETMFINESKDRSMTKGKLNRNDIVMTTRGTIGNIVFYSQEIPFKNIRINSGMVILRSKINDSLYDFTFLNSPRFDKTIKFTVFGSAQPQLTVKDIKKMKISFPEQREEQEKISSFFLLLNRRIKKQQEKIEKLEQFKKGMTQKIFAQELRFKDEDGRKFSEWEEKELREMAEVIMGQSPKGNNYSTDNQNTVLIQGNADMKDGKVVPRIYTSEVTKTCLPRDIIMSVRASVGEIALTDIEACIGRGVCAIRGSKYVYHYLSYFNGINGWNNLSQGSTFESVNGNDIKTLTIPTPSFEEQEKIAEYLTKLERKAETEKEKLIVLEEQKKGFMQGMFV